MEARRLDKPLKLLTFAMVCLGVLSIILTGYLPSPEPLGIVVLLIIGFFFWESKLHTRGYAVVWHVLTIIFLGWCSQELLLRALPGRDITARVPMAAMRLSVFLQIFKVYNAKGDRDYVHMFLLSFFQFVSCAGVSVEFYLLPLFLMYLTIAMSGLAVFHFRRHLAAPGPAVASPAVVTPRPGRGRLLTTGFFAGTCLASLVMVVIAAMLFIFFPRSRTSDNPLAFQGFLGSLGTRLSSGLSDSVHLDIAGIINHNPLPIMRASFSNLAPVPHSVLWRRGAMHVYDGKGKRWLRPTARYSSASRRPRGDLSDLVNVLVRKSPGFFVIASEVDKYDSVEDLENDGELVAQKYTTLFSHSRAPILSAFCPPVAVLANVRSIGCDVDEAFHCEQRTRRNFTYTVFTRIPSRVSSESEGVGATPRELDVNKRRMYTELPEELDPRFGQLARQITQHAATEYEQARAVRDYLTMNCQYSIILTQTPGRKGPLYDFVFGNKPGHCEYFASAMVILLRELGIPSRLAHGYSTGSLDDEKRGFEIRLSDAHAWAEAFIENKGWTPFDPTPAIATAEAPQTFFSVLLTPVTRWLRFCENQWAEGVIGYTRKKQRSAFQFVASGFKTVFGGMKQFALSVGEGVSQLWAKMARSDSLRLLFLVLGASVLLAITVGLLRLRRGGRFHRLYRRQNAAWHPRWRVKFYEKMLRLLMDRGLTKEPADTPLEFADKVVSANQPLSGVQTLTSLYYFVRFGGGKLTPQQARTVQRVLRELSQRLSPEARRP